MESDLPPSELILNDSQRSLGKVHLDWTPQPGAHVDFDGQTYQVLERRHRYRLKANRYHLHQIALYVQSAALPDELTWLQDRWVIGDITCRFNAQSELLRCAVNPNGPCRGCAFYGRG